MECPECSGEIRVSDDAIDGELVTCPDCGGSFEVYRDKGNLALRPAEVVGEDWGE